MTLNLCLLGRDAKAVAIEALDPARNLLEQEGSIDPVPAGGVESLRQS